MKKIRLFILSVVMSSLCIVCYAFRNDLDDVQQSVQVEKKKNPGDLSYKNFFKVQERLKAKLPIEPRMIDLIFRVNFAAIGKAEMDDYWSPKWSVAIVSENVDSVVPISRGGYFELPNLPQARDENAKLMFNAPTIPNNAIVEFVVRHRENTISYREFEQAINEFKSLQEQIKWYELSLREVRDAKVDSLKVCFEKAGGLVMVGNETVSNFERGRCVWIKFDKNKLEANPRIQFVGQVEFIFLSTINEAINGEA